MTISRLNSDTTYLPAFRNLVINGAMQVAQRGTSVTGITAGGYTTVDRWGFFVGSQGTWTMTVENDAPTGSGFRKSAKVLCTTADAAPAAGDYVIFQQTLEGQNLQAIKKGTANAEQLSLSFWVKSNVTGTYIVNVGDLDNTRHVGASFSVSSSGTWEKKTIVFPADTTGAFDNDNSGSLRFTFWLGGGSNFTSGTLDTTWGTATLANTAPGVTNLAAATNNYWQITGVQLEVGAVATPFEFKPFAQDLIECQRYYYRNTPGTDYGYQCLAQVRSATQVEGAFHMPTSMRTGPTALEFANLAVERAGVASYAITSGSMSSSYVGPNSVKLAFTNNNSSASAGQSINIINNNNTAAYIAVSAEL